MATFSLNVLGIINLSFVRLFVLLHSLTYGISENWKAICSEKKRKTNHNLV